ncbi:MAG: alpha/beta hydrolase [Spirochaetales bacterium]|jgi:acetyl esterase/lipase|nr:alpha/beta hydrolase [Spirochaetales bacterium]
MKNFGPLTIDPAWFRPDAVDSDTIRFNEKLEKLMEAEPPVNEIPAAESRRLREAGTPRTGPIVLSPRAIQRGIPGPAGEVPLRIFLPEKIRGVFLHIHGGGWVLGRAHLQDPYLEAMAKNTRCAVISVDYRLAPEHPYPAAPDDCEAAARWLIENGEKEFGAGKFIIGGDSAGAQLSVVTLLRLKKSRGRDTGFAGAHLVYGVFDLCGTPSMRNYGKRRIVLNTSCMQWFADQFAPPEIRRQPDVSPLYASAEDLAGMPPAIFIVGTEDLLLDDSLFMASRWVSAGGSAELAVYPGAGHGFIGMTHSPAKKARAKGEEFFEALLGG